MPTPPRRFRSKVDGWLVALLVAPALLPFVLHPAGGVEWPMLVVLLPMLGFTAWTFTTTWYDVTDETLVVRSGPFRWRIPLATIRSITPSRSFLSSPALSLDRLEIRHDAGFLLVSPKERDAFIATVSAGAPQAGRARDSAAASASSPGISTVLPVLVPMVLVVVLVVVGVFYAGTRPITVRVTSEQAAFSGGTHAVTVDRAQVASATLVTDLPRTRKVSGFNGAGYERGIFDVTTIGRSDLFVRRGHPPYLVIRLNPAATSHVAVIINLASAAETTALYQRLQQAWSLP